MEALWITQFNLLIVDNFWKNFKRSKLRIHFGIGQPLLDLSECGFLGNDLDCCSSKNFNTWGFHISEQF